MVGFVDDVKAGLVASETAASRALHTNVGGIPVGWIAAVCILAIIIVLVIGGRRTHPAPLSLVSWHKAEALVRF